MAMTFDSSYHDFIQRDLTRALSGSPLFRQAALRTASLAGACISGFLHSMHFAPAFGGPQRRIRLFSETFPCRTRAEVIRTLAKRRITVWRITGAPGRWTTWFRLRGRKDTLGRQELSTSVWRGVERPTLSTQALPEAHRPCHVKNRCFWHRIMKNKALLAAGIAGLMAAGSSKGATVASSAFQSAGSTNIDTYITNNDNAIYNSATFDLVGTYGNLLQAIKDNNPTYAGLGLNDIASNIGTTIRSNPTGEVNNGWTSAYDIATGKVTLAHINGIPGLSYDQWNSAVANNDMMALTFNFGNMLDFNDNGVTDFTELLQPTGTTYTNGFRGIEGGLQYGGDTPMFELANIPEPSSALLVGIGGLGLAMRRRREFRSAFPSVSKGSGIRAA
ncbi:PEP-CTERM sorting domain-containing protein [Haloferula sp. A504]|uniref:PEP-CTERM sorting domain-containing protein n=1 Tax=Haloferula sp. A504 TaxID=3373601 RepID=UPI0031C738AB|nr:PEP-CTERM sorting domain-containing protein [Verrucomicrobiaceae bacterium E54]